MARVKAGAFVAVAGFLLLFLLGCAPGPSVLHVQNCPVPDANGSLPAAPSSCRGSSGDVQSPEPRDQTFGPTFPATRPAGQLVRIDDATIDDNGGTLVVRFIGGPGYAPADFCSTDYEPWVAPDGDALQVAITVVTHADQATAPPNVACAAVGYPHAFALLLPSPFEGSTVHDLAGNTLWVRAPSGLVEPKRLPVGWELRWSGDEPNARPPLWSRAYAAAGTDVQGVNGGAGRLDLYQAFGEATSIGGGSERRDVNIGDVTGVLLRDPLSGELLLQWRIGADGVALVANEADMTIDELLAIAGDVQPSSN